MPERVRNPRRVHSDSWVSMLWRLTCSDSVSSRPLQARLGSLFMIVMMRCRRVGGWGGGTGVVAVVVAAGGACDPAGAVAGPACGQQGGQHSSSDHAEQVGGLLGADAGRAGELVFRGVQGGGEAGPVGVGARAGFYGGDHGHAQQLVDGE